MLLRMYLRWAERHKFRTEIYDYSEGDEAGVKGGGGDVRAEREDPASGFVVRDVLDLLGEREVWISFEVSGLHHDVLNVIAIGADAFAAETIEGLAELSGAGGFLDVIGAGAETAIHAIEENRRAIRMRDRDDLGSGQPAGEINPVVNVERRVADAELGSGEVLEAFEDDLF